MMNCREERFIPMTNMMSPGTNENTAWSVMSEDCMALSPDVLWD